ncbi:DUF6985 domain-containing protein [Cytobacillus solani]|uniref:DUF6985 domain-containing protein n=1 Tax=Cytobacillus solani TaxID=1637975 RepID=A0A0Q3VHP7_9BACI|nr:hypothetical protein [Cytobacillus solani]KOP82905.1 hypothetical protein AMS60_10735 [Bacillus sp. FJAT-21945]KQL19927.1 hypothetical protein AN957_16045 [Cytobacillus solani]USK53171.1 hypothetical protein LIS82_16290 [Cytobacillus solani]
MKEINHVLLGRFHFEEEQCVWRQVRKISIFNKTFEANIDFLEYDEEFEQVVEFEEDTKGYFQEEQVEALVKFQEKRHEIISNLETAIFEYYQNNREVYDAPFLKNKNEIGSLLTDMGIFIADREEAGLRKMGITFECSWEPGHGLGILLKNEEIAAVGTIDDAVV